MLQERHLSGSRFQEKMRDMTWTVEFHIVYMHKDSPYQSERMELDLFTDKIN